MIKTDWLGGLSQAWATGPVPQCDTDLNFAHACGEFTKHCVPGGPLQFILSVHVTLVKAVNLWKHLTTNCCWW